MPTSPTALRVDIERFWSTLEHSAKVGAGRPGGLSRLALSDADKQIRDDFARWCEAAGLTLRIDAMGSMFARRAGQDDSLAPVLLGSHLDTQVNGGRFDGIAGVLGALEVCRALDDAAHVTRRPLEIVNWTNEEGARFSPPMVAAGVYAGSYELAWGLERRDQNGLSIGEELKRIGYAGSEMARPDIDAYFELHIEQGPLLDLAGDQVGVVVGGYTSSGMLAEFRGETAHTGPWPMELRRNALAAAARFLVAVDDLGWDYAGSGGKATAASLSASPNRPGILSDWAQAVCDVRHADPRVAMVMKERMRRAAHEAAARANCTVEVLDTWDWGGEMFAPELVDLVRSTSKGLGYRTQDILSQAGHDAYFVARVAPTAMIFTPCKDGITHNNNELCTRADLEPGLNVLLQAVVRRADRQ